MDNDNPQAETAQAEHTVISASLELEQLDENLFRSSTRWLWVPSRARGVFGGQVISQALVAATKTVPEEFHCHSLHCYFLQSADASVPIIYYVDRVRQGKSFTTRGIKALQRGKPVFILLASFSKVEIGHPVSQWPDFPHVKPAEQCKDQADRILEWANAEQNEDRKTFLMQLRQDRLLSPVEIRIVNEGPAGEGKSAAKFWMRARKIPKYEPSFQKCILAYISDLQFLSTTSRAVRLNPANEGNTAITMMASLDHSLWFYDHDFDCSEWLLFVMDSPRVGLGRGVVYGLFYDMRGKIIAAAAQEGVARGDPRKRATPSTAVSQSAVAAKNKL